MMAALSANSSAALDPIERAFAVSQQLVKSNLEALGKGAGNTKLRDASLKLLALGEGENGVYKVRQRELDAIESG